MGGIVPVGVLLGVLEDVLAAVRLGVGDVLGGRAPKKASMKTRWSESKNALYQQRTTMQAAYRGFGE